MRYVATRPFPTAARQYQGGEEINTSAMTSAEFMRGISDGSVIPARFYGTAAQVAAITAVPGPGVPVFEEDTRVYRIGDGVTPIGSLPEVGSLSYSTYGRSGETDIWDDFTQKEDGSLTTPILGGAYRTHGGSIGETAVPRIVSGALTYVPTAGGAGYAEIPLTGRLRRIGGRFTLSPYTTNSGSVVLIGWVGPVSATFPTIPDTPCHLAVTAIGWQYLVFQGNASTSIASGTWAAPLATDGTVHSVEMMIDSSRAKAYLFLPDGSIQIISHAYLGSMTPTYACWELYRASSTDSIGSWINTWADSTSDAALVRGLRATTSPLPTYALSYQATSADITIPSSTGDLDATNLVLPAFNAPASGKVLVEFSGQLSMTASAGVLWGVRNGSTTLNLLRVMDQQFSGTCVYRRVLSLSAGASYTLKWAGLVTVAGAAKLKIDTAGGYHPTMSATPLPF